MAASKIYNRVNWAAFPSLSTPLTANNLNKMDEGIDNLDNRVVGLLNRMDTAETNISNQGSSITSLQNTVSGLMYYTEPVSCEIGDTTVTITDENILETSIIHFFTQTESGSNVGYNTIVASTGEAVITFDALKEATDIILQVINL